MAEGLIILRLTRGFFFFFFGGKKKKKKNRRRKSIEGENLLKVSVIDLDLNLDLNLDLDLGTNFGMILNLNFISISFLLLFSILFLILFLYSLLNFLFSLFWYKDVRFCQDFCIITGIFHPQNLHCHGHLKRFPILFPFPFPIPFSFSLTPSPPIDSGRTWALIVALEDWTILKTTLYIPAAEDFWTILEDNLYVWLSFVLSRLPFILTDHLRLCHLRLRLRLHLL